MPDLNCVVDLSHHDADPDFAAAAGDGIMGVIHKATQGTRFVDPTYAARCQPALDAGLLWGAYHFGIGGDGAEQAAHFLETVKPDARTLLALDFEQNPQGSSMTLAQAHDFVTAVYDAVGRWPGLYAGNYLRELLGNGSDPVLANCFLWWALYGSSILVPANWSDWTLWQYTDGAAGPQPHTVKGIGRCDRSTFNGDAGGLRRLWGAEHPQTVSVTRTIRTVQISSGFVHLISPREKG
jgi:lysozyme